MAAKVYVEPLPFKGLSASVDPALVPVGWLASMEGASVERGGLETGPRYGDAWSRPGAAAGDAGRGVFLAAYDGLVEFVAIVRAQGEATCRAYRITAAGAWTQLASGLPDAVWTFRQYEDRVYACAAGAGVWVHTAGWTAPSDPTAGNLLFDRFAPTYSGVIGAAAVDALRPSYPQRVWGDQGLGVGIDTKISFDTSLGALGTGSSGANSISTTATILASGEIAIRASATVSAPRTLVHTVVVTLPQTLALTDLADPLNPDGGAGQEFLQYFLTPAKAGTDGSTGSLNGPDPAVDRSGASVALSGPATPTIFEQYLALSSDGATAPTQAWADAQPRARLSIYGAEPGAAKAVVCDLRSIPASVRGAVKRIVLRVAMTYTGSGAELRVSPLSMGGAAIHEWTAAEPDAPSQDYAVAFYDPTSGAYSTATKATLAKPLAGGARLAPSSMPLGAWPRFQEAENATLYGQGFTKVRLFRSLVLSGGQSWRLAAEAPNAGNPGGVAVLVDRVGNVALPSRASAALQFGDMAAALVADAVGVWKQHFLVLSQRLLFGSWAGEPTRYLPPPEQDYEIPEEDDLTQGRTLYVAMDRTEGALASVEADLLYLCARRGASVMIGDSMLGATPPRRLPGSKGALGPLACCAHDAGILLGALDGLWYLEATRSFTGSSDGTYSSQETTSGVRDAWRRLVGADGSGLVVASWDDEVWAFNAGRYLRMTRELGDGARAWEEGPFPAVAGVAASPGYGARAILADGRVVRLWRDASNARYETDAGAAGTWSATTGWIPSGRRLLTGISARVRGAPTVVVESRERTKGVATQTIRLDEARLVPAGVGRRPGAEHRFTFSGAAGADAILDMALTWEDAGGGQGA